MNRMSGETESKKPMAMIANMFLMFLLSFLLTGCAGTVRTYFRHEFDFGTVKKIAVVPLANLTTDRFAGERVTHTLITELLIRTDFIVVEEGEVNRVLKEAGAQASGEGDLAKTFDTVKLKKFKESLGVQAVLLGSVDQYEMVRIGSDSYPLVTLSVRLVEVETGAIVWRSTMSRKGGPSSVPFLSLGEVYTLPELTHRVCRVIVSSLK